MLGDINGHFESFLLLENIFLLSLPNTHVVPHSLNIWVHYNQSVPCSDIAVLCDFY